MTIIAFISQKGGVGKSTLAQALAVEAKRRKINLLLADCDPQQTTSYEWSRIKSKIPSQVFSSVTPIWPLVKQYDLIIIDGPAHTSQATQEIAERADLILQPSGASRADLVPAIKEFHALKAAGIKPEKLLLVLKRIATPSEATAAQEFCQASGYRSLSTFLYEKASYRQVQNEGKSIAEVGYKKLRQQVKLLITDLLKYI